ncbi:hypothetical protein BDF14DRAFT_1764825 [Spinellus fusiger]|nr:hypothetical protein BDF14DRAFT_1764825 [Spinellus fusiger]
MEDHQWQTTLTSFNFEVPNTDKDGGVLSKFISKVKTAVAGQPSYHQEHSLYCENGSLYEFNVNSSSLSIASSGKQTSTKDSPTETPEKEAAAQKNRLSRLATPLSCGSSLQHHIYVTSPTPPASSKDSVVVNFSSPSSAYAYRKEPASDLGLAQFAPSVSRSDSHEDPPTPVDYCIGTPLRPSRSTDSDTQSIITTFSVSTSNSLARILARLRGQKSDKEFWMPDEQCKECYKCRKQFTLLRRRHHCRTCGQIFCAKCASNVVSGKTYQQKGQVRLCNFCYSKYSQGDIGMESDTDKHSYLDTSLPLPTTTADPNSYAPVIPSQKPPLAAPQMQIPTTALKQTYSLYGSADTTTVALEISARESPSMIAQPFENPPNLFQSSPLITVSTLGPLTATTDAYGDGGLKRLLGAGTSLLKSRSRSNTSSSAPLEDTRLLSQQHGNKTTVSPILSMDRGGGTVMTESELSLFVALDETKSEDIDYYGYDLWSRPTGHLAPRIPSQSQSYSISQTQPQSFRLQTSDISLRDYVGSDDEAYDHRLRDKRTEELRDQRSHSPLRRQNMNHQRRSSRLRNIHINTTNLPKSNSQAEIWSPNPFLTPLESKSDHTASKSRFLVVRQKRISTPPNVELSYGALSHAKKLLKQLMETSLHHVSEEAREVWEDTIMSLLLKVTDHVRPDVRAGDDMDVRHYVKIKKIPGGLPCDSFYVKGVVCSKNVAHKRMMHPIVQPRILILLFSLDYSRVEMENQLLSILPVITQEKEHLSKLVGRIVALKPSLLLVKSTVSRLALEFLLEANIPVIHNVKHSVIEAVARCTQASIVPSVDKLQVGLSFGNCGSLEIRTMMHEWIPNRRKTYLIFDGCEPELGGTIVLRGATNKTLQIIKRLIDFMVFVINNLKLETSVLRDSFAKNRGVEQPSHPLRMTRARRQSSFLLLTGEKGLVDQEESEQVESLDELLNVYRDTILSASQFVVFPPPYLLVRLKETEDTLASASKMRKIASASPTRNHFDRTANTELLKPSEHAESVILNADFEHLIAKHYQLARAWDTYIGESPDYISPFYHQNIVVLYSDVCTITTVPCQGPEIRIFEYYRYPSDMTLGQYLTDLFMDAKEPCSSFMCDHPMLQHFRSYAHGGARINVMIEPFACPQPGMSDKLLMWNYCKECNRPTPVIPMSDNTWNYSFGKFLEVFLYQTGVFCRADICPHDMTRHHVRYFGYMDLAVRFQYDPIDLLEVAAPPMKLFMLSQVQIDIKESELKILRNKINKFYKSITERNKAFPYDLVDPRKIEACKSELQEMSHQCMGEKKQVLQILQNVYATTEASDTLTMNWVRRILYQQISQWDMDYADLVRHYLQPERELRKITTTHLRKMFPTDISEAAITHMDDERTKRATEDTDLPILGIELSEGDNNESSVEYLANAIGKPTHQPFLLPCLSSSPTHLDIKMEEIDTSPGKPPIERRLVPNPTTRQSLLRPEIRRQLSIELMRELQTKFKQDEMLSDKEIQLFAGNYIRPKRSIPSTAPFPPSRIPVPHLHADRTKPTPLYEPYTPHHQRFKQTYQKTPTKTKPTTQQTGFLTDYRHRRFQTTLSPSLETPKSIFPFKPLDQHTPPYIKQSAEDTKYTNTKPLSVSVLGDIRRSNTRERHFRSRLPRKKTYIQVYTRANDLVKEDMEDEFLVGEPDDVAEEDMSERRGFYDLSHVREHLQNDRVDYFSPTAPYTSNVDTTEAIGLPTTEEPEEEETPKDTTYCFPTAYELLNPPLTDIITTSISTTCDKVVSQSPSFHGKRLVPVVSTDMLGQSLEVLDEFRHSPPGKNSFMKTITSFLTDSVIANLLPLEPPLQSTEHIFPDSFVVVREDEPSTIIAYTLSCDDYLVKMHDMQDTMGEEVPDDATVNTSTVFVDDTIHDTSHDVSNTIGSTVSPADIQETLLRESGTHMRYNFSDGTSKFFCKIFFSEQFDALRRNCGCDESYILSLANCIKWDSSGGKSGSAFLKTKDDRLLMKQMSRYELDAFLLFAPAYFQYMSEAFFSELPTVLAKIFGFYSIGYKNSATGKSMRMDILVMENLFYQRNVKKIFDLKGSMRNRHVQSTGKQDEVLLDENLVELIYQSPLFIRAHAKEILRSSLHNDTLFLSGRNVMDYSLLVGIDEERQELVVGIVDFIRTFTWDKKLESWVKDSGFLGGGGKEPTIVSPRQYRIRFREAMERYFLMVPDLWALARQSRSSHDALHHHPMSLIEE